MRHYEVVAVIHPDQGGRIASMIELYKKIVADDGGVMHRLEDWGRRPLAYPIQNQQKAQYVLMNIECESATVDKLRETFRFSDSIIRSMVIRRDKAITAPSVVMRREQNRAEEEGDSENSVDFADGGRDDSAVADSQSDADSDSNSNTDSAAETSAAAESKEEAKGEAKPAADSAVVEETSAAAESVKTESAKGEADAPAAAPSESESKAESESETENKENEK